MGDEFNPKIDLEKQGKEFLEKVDLKQTGKRLEEFLVAKNLHVHEAAKETLMHPSEMYSMIQGESYNVQNFANLMARYRDLNPDWLYFGMGPMLKNMEKVAQREARIRKNAQKRVDEAQEKVDEAHANLEKKEKDWALRHNEALKEMAAIYERLTKSQGDLVESHKELANSHIKMAEKDRELVESHQKLSEKDREIGQKDLTIKKLKAQLAKLQN